MLYIAELRGGKKVGVKLAIKLPGAVTGYQLDDAVRLATGREYHKQELHDVEGVVREIGGNSEYPYRDFKIAVGPDATTEIDMAAKHTEAYVVSCEHDGAKLPVSFSDKTVAKAMLTIRDKIQAALEKGG